MEKIYNFLPLEEQEALVSYVYSESIAYRFYHTHRYSGEVVDRWKHAPIQMSHFLYEIESDIASKHLPMINSIFSNLKHRFGNIRLLRAKINVTSPYPPMMNYEHQVPHIDLQYDNGDPVDHKVLLYYINDSDGPTYFFNESYEITEAVQPSQGTAIIFGGDEIHAASNPVKTPFRFVINIDFQEVR